ncbi:hypothetical protein GGF32_000247 [Allomyces javanicus]|nr:hypothetical protein GGF32_000247 [Allomyces javanicus]
MLHGCLYETQNTTKPMACSNANTTSTITFTRCSSSKTTASTVDIGAYLGATIATSFISLVILALYLRHYRHKNRDPGFEPMDVPSAAPSFFGVFKRFSKKRKRKRSSPESVLGVGDSAPPIYSSHLGNSGLSSSRPLYLTTPSSSSAPPSLLQPGAAPRPLNAPPPPPRSISHPATRFGRAQIPDYLVAASAPPALADSHSEPSFPTIARTYPTLVTTLLPESKFKLHGNHAVNDIPSMLPTTSNLLSGDSNQKMVDEWQAVFNATQLAVTAWLPTGTLSGRLMMTRPHSRAVAMSVVAQFIVKWLDHLVADALDEPKILAYDRVAERIPLPPADSFVDAVMAALDKLEWSKEPSDREASRAKLGAIFTTVAATWCRMRCADMTVAAYTALSKVDFDGALMKDGATLTNSSSADFEKLMVAACMFPGIVHRTFDGRPSLLSPVVVLTDMSTGQCNALPAI